MPLEFVMLTLSTIFNVTGNANDNFKTIFNINSNFD